MTGAGLFRVTRVECPHGSGHQADPQFPEGQHLEMRTDRSLLGCVAQLPYPIDRPCAHAVECLICAARMMVIAAGTPDDFKSVTLPCQGMHVA